MQKPHDPTFVERRSALRLLDEMCDHGGRWAGSALPLDILASLSMTGAYCGARAGEVKREDEILVPPVMTERT